MPGSIFLLDDQGRLQSLSEQGHQTEDAFQHLLECYPQLLAGELIDQENPRRWLLVTREIGIPSERDGADRWALDHLFLDQDGIPTLVEVKRSSDSRIRREVVGQMLDYAANCLAYWSQDHIQQRYEARIQERGGDPEEELKAFLDGADRPYEAFWQDVRTNLKAGRLRLLFVADEIPVELRRIVEFLNSQMNQTEVLAVEIKQYAGSGVRTLVPRVIGGTASAAAAKGRSRPKGSWDEQSYFDELTRQRGLVEVDVAKRVLTWAKHSCTRVWWGQGAVSGSFVPEYDHNGARHQLFAAYTYGTLEIYFQHYSRKPPFDSQELRLEMVRRLNQVPGVSIPDDAIARRPTVKLAALVDHNSTVELLAVFDWYLEQIRRA